MRAGLVAVLWVVLGSLAWWSGTPPQPLPEEAPARVFSATRAIGVLEELWDGQPRPTGSPANKAFRARLTAQLEGLGLTVEEQTGGGLTNLMTRVEGGEPGAILLIAHHDTTPHGPGANDNGVGVASLVEIARALLASDRPLRHPVIFLFDDGEEIGLRGAKLFRDEHPWADEVEVVLDLEARGSRGPSLMFQTIGEAGWLVDIMAMFVSHPVSSSGFSAVYERMPNDTNLTVFRDAGVSGLDFAYIGGLEDYHRPTDDLAHVDPRTVQHHGGTVLEVVRGIQAKGIRHREGRAVFYEVFGLHVFRWQMWLNLPMAAVVLFGVTGWTGRSMSRLTGAPGRDLSGRGLILALGTIGLTVGLEGLLFALVGPVGVSDASMAMGLTQVASVLALAASTWAPVTQQERWSGVWALWGVLGLAMAWWVPGLSYLCVVPCLIAATLSSGTVGASVVCAIVASTVWFRVLWLLPDALGAHLWVVHGLVGGLFVTAWLPVFGDPMPRESDVGS